MERRKSERREVVFPIALGEADKKPGIAITRNLSRHGVLAVTAGKLAVGEPVTVTLEPPGWGKGPQEIQGTIVRVDANDADPDGLWPKLVAVSFEDVVEDLTGIMKALAATSEQGD